MTTPTHRLTILVDQTQYEQLSLFLMSMGCAFTTTPMTDLIAQQQNQGNNVQAGSPQAQQKGLTLRILRAATANGSKGIHRRTISQMATQNGFPPSLINSTMTSLIESGKLTSVGRGLYKRAA
jgi:sulfur relay (sulfurtransferase) complex TusBCD TusD component (DsrE family)